MTLLNGVLPTQGNYLTMTHVEAMRQRISLTQDEASALGTPTEEGEIKHPDLSAVPDKEIEFSEADYTIISDALIGMNKKSTHNAEHVPLYRKFVRESGKENDEKPSNDPVG